MADRRGGFDAAQGPHRSARGITLEAASFPYRVAGRILPSDIDGKENRVYRRPLGVIGIISPWNFPLHLTQRSLAPALALGNAAVVKPASDTPVTGALLAAKIFEEAGLPARVLNVTIGAGSEIGDYFVEHRVPRLISFTGSTPVGRGIARLAAGGEHIKRVALELGGNSPFVVLDDADVDQAARAAALGRFLHQGQICMSVNRIIVDARLYDDFVERFVAQVRGLKTGDPNDPATAVGPIINRSQLQGLLERIDQARREGARMVLGGEPDGQLLPPHVFTDVSPQSPLARDESFGPIVPILRAANEAEALALANGTDYGLSSAVFSGDIDRGALCPAGRGGHDARERRARAGRAAHSVWRRKELRSGALRWRMDHRGVHLRALDLRATHQARISVPGFPLEPQAARDLAHTPPSDPAQGASLTSVGEAAKLAAPPLGEEFRHEGESHSGDCGRGAALLSCGSSFRAGGEQRELVPCQVCRASAADEYHCHWGQDHRRGPLRNEG